MNRGKHKLSIDVSHAIITIIVFVLFQETYFGPQPPTSVLKQPLINYVKGRGVGHVKFYPYKKGDDFLFSHAEGGAQ